MQETASVQATDWNLIQSLYLQGLSPKQIEAETGVKAQSVSVRANRKGWTAALAKVKQVARVTEDSDVEGKSELDSHSQRVRNALAVDLSRVCKLLEDKPSTSLSSGLKRQQALVPLVQNAKIVMGWDTQGQSPSVRISVLAQCTVIPAGYVPTHTQESERSEVVDTEVVHVPDKSILLPQAGTTEGEG